MFKRFCLFYEASNNLFSMWFISQFLWHFCFSCGSKLTKQNFPSKFTAKRDRNLFSMNRTTIYEGQSIIYEYNNPDFIYKIENAYTISNILITILFIEIKVLFTIYILSPIIGYLYNGPSYILSLFFIYFY